MLFGMEMCTLLCLKWILTMSYCIAHGTLFRVVWWPEWEGSFGENGYIYMYG